MNRVLTAIIFVIFISTGYISFLVSERQHELQKLTQYTTSWSVGQLVSEYFKLESWLGLYAMNDKNVTRDIIRLRLDIMLSQNELMKGGDLFHLIEKTTEHRTLAAKLDKNLQYLDMQLSVMSQSDIEAFLIKMHELDTSMSMLSSSAMSNDLNAVNITNHKIKNLYSVYTVLSVLLMVLSMILGIMILYQNKNIMKAHGQVKRLAEELQSSKEKLQHQNKKLKYDVYHDSLTGMRNRLYFWKHLKIVITLAQLNGGSVTVMLFDLDRFKEVNDTLGHDAGDKLLQEIATRLANISYKNETFYRLGGDEFALISSDLTENMAVERARIISDCVSQTYSIYGATVNIETCVGIFISDTERRSDYIYKSADLALYDAKRKGASHIKVFKPEMLQQIKANMMLEKDLLHSLDNDELKVYYQPIIDSYSGKIDGYEALLRWFHPSRGMVAPDVFIPIAEKTGFINKVGRWVLEKACMEAASWKVAASISVNVSPVQLNSISFVDIVMSALKKSGLAAERLELEITESTLFNESDTSLSILVNLRKMGVKVSIDDFGTGYSSLSRLSMLSFDKIKIDKSFIKDISTQKDAFNITKLMLVLARRLNMKTVAEGVETEEQLECLQSLGCDLVQGYLFGKAEPLIDETITFSYFTNVIAD